MGKEYESVDIRGLESVEMVCRRAEPEEATERKLEAVQILHCKYEEVRGIYFLSFEGREAVVCVNYEIWGRGGVTNLFFILFKFYYLDL